MVSFFKASIIVAAFGVLFKPVIYPFFVSQIQNSRYDEEVGKITVVQSFEALAKTYEKKKVLIVGGTRGIGRGVAIAVAKAGADVTVVGRSERSGRAIVELLKYEVLSQENDIGKVVDQRINYIQGDIGSVKSAKACVASLAEYASEYGKFDFLVVTAAIFPNWDNLMNEDGLERSFGIAVVGRYIIFNSAELFLKPNTSRILNVLASGMNTYPFDRELASGTRMNGSLAEYVLNFACGAELMQISLNQRNKFYNSLTKVSVHPGILKTELHDNQGWLMDTLEPLLVKLVGFTEEQAGVRQASILSSSQLVEGQLNYVDEFMIGRKLGSKVPVDEHLEWLMDLIEKRIQA